MNKIEILQANTPELRQKALEIRLKVFVEEQKIPIEYEQDGLDETAVLLLAFQNQNAVATGRMIIHKNHAHIARIAVLNEYRGLQIAQKIVLELEKIAIEKNVTDLVLYPHIYLENFYKKLGFYTENIDFQIVAGYQLLTMRKKI
ncbi:MAG: GNAT family N-acetyltransferase [Bacteroidetes bacterium]|nr:MAG: GNAT family N-acetyltransferase [Bacteroidota bacterium]